MRFFSSTLLVSILFFTFVCCSTNSTSTKPLSLKGTFTKSTLTHQEIFELKINGGSLYAGTDNNLYRKSIPEAEWVSLGLANRQVRTFVVLSDQHLLAALNMGNQDSLTIGQTIDGGQHWISFRNGFGGGINRRIPSVMVSSPNASDLLFAGGPGLDIGRSSKQGDNWELVLGTWENLGFLFFIKINASNPKNIFAGGSDAIFQPTLSKSTDKGATWNPLDKNIAFGSEANAYDLIINANNSKKMLIGFGGSTTSANIIRKSTDGGQNWETVYEGINTRTLAHSARDQQVVYASGQNAAGTLFFVASGDFGDTWQTVEMPDSPAGIRINDMVTVMQSGREVLYFGTNKGVYSYTLEQ